MGKNGDLLPSSGRRVEGKGEDGKGGEVIKCWTPRAAGRRSVAERIFVAPPYYSQHAVFASL